MSKGYEKIVTFRIGDDSHRALQELVNRTGDSASEILRRIVEEGLANYGVLLKDVSVSQRIHSHKVQQERYLIDIRTIEELYEAALEIKDESRRAEELEAIRELASELNMPL